MSILTNEKYKGAALLQKRYTVDFLQKKTKVNEGDPARRNRMEAESVSIGGMLTELEELEAPPIEFDEKLWHAVVDRVTIYNDDRLVYSLKDGSEITVML